MIKDHILRNQATETLQQNKSVSVSIVENELLQASLSEAFMRGAEVHQPWSTIGVDEWIESGRWWLLRSQMELYAVSKQNQAVPAGAYTNLIKASWILVDILSCHPQLPFITATTHAQVRLLSAELKKEFLRLARLDSSVPGLSEIEHQNLRIWETGIAVTTFRPFIDMENPGNLIIGTGEQVLFQKFAFYYSSSHVDAIPCILLFLVHKDAGSVRSVAHDQNGLIIKTFTSQEIRDLARARSLFDIGLRNVIFVNDEDLQYLKCLSEAAISYHDNPRIGDTHIDDFIAFVLLIAVKNRCENLVDQTYQKLYSTGELISTGPGAGVLKVAFHIATQYIKSRNDGQMLDHDMSKGELSSLPLWYWAMKHGHADLVKVFLDEQGTRPEDEFGKSERLMNEFPELLATREEPMSGYYNNLSISDEFGGTALHAAAAAGHVDLAILLLKFGPIGVDTTNNFGWTALHLASLGGYEQMVRLLLINGANIDTEVGDATALDLARQVGEEGVASLLVNASRILPQEGLDVQLVSQGLWESDSELAFLLVRKDLEFVNGRFVSRSQLRRQHGFQW